MNKQTSLNQTSSWKVERRMTTHVLYGCSKYGWKYKNGRDVLSFVLLWRHPRTVTFNIKDSSTIQRRFKPSRDYHRILICPDISDQLLQLSSLMNGANVHAHFYNTDYDEGCRLHAPCTLISDYYRSIDVVGKVTGWLRNIERTS